MGALLICDFFKQAVQPGLLSDVLDFEVKRRMGHGHRCAGGYYENLAQTLSSEFCRPKMACGKKKSVVRSKPFLVSIHQTAALSARDPDQDMFLSVMRKFCLPGTARRKT